MVSIIAAVAENGVIGRDNDLIWHLPADLKRFRELTMGHHMVMGRKTYESIGRALPGRTTVVVSRNPQLKVDGLLALSLQDAIAKCADDNEIFITGGAEIYRQALPLSDRIYLTRVHHTFEGDTFFPEPDWTQWISGSPDAHKADEKNPYDYTFITYNRK